MRSLEKIDEETIVGKAYDARLMKRLLAYLYPYRRYLILSLGALLIFTSIDLFASV
ncbi:MAG: hypothetical protein ACP5I1_05080 [Candidatus Hinthialibacter sp.]